MISADDTPPSTCAEVEEKFGGSGKKGTYYRKHFPGCECERHEVSPFSPGRVTDGELLGRLVIPTHVGINAATGMRSVIHVAIMGVEELGLSVIRLAYASRSEINSKIEYLAEKKGVLASEILLATIGCSTIFSIRNDGMRVYCIIDSAKEDDPSHADIHRGLDFPPGTPDQKNIFRGQREILAGKFRIQGSAAAIFR